MFNCKHFINALVFFQKYESWKDNLPDMGWVDRFIPEQDKLDQFSQEIRKFARNISLPELPRPKKVSFVLLLTILQEIPVT